MKKEILILIKVSKGGSSVVERYVDIEEVISSILIIPAGLSSS